MTPPAISARFELGESLGRGAFGQVFRAHDTALEQSVAVKFLHVGNDEPEAFLKEIAVLRLLRLPGVVVQIDDGIADDGRPYLVTEFVDGEHFPGRSGPLGWSELENVAVALLEAMQRVHDAGMTHRDLKPANVVVRDTGVPVILDFGLARQSADRTREDMLTGTPSYLAPEQALGRLAGPRADIYAVGVMLYEALTGRRPLEGRNGPDVIARKVDTEPTPISTYRPDAPTWVLELVDRMVARAPRDRPESAAAVLEAMHHALPVAFPRRLGGPIVDEIADGLMAGESLTVGGPSGSGRSRLVDDLAAELSGRGATVVKVRGTEPSDAPDGAEPPVVWLVDSPGTPAVEPPPGAHAHLRVIDGADADVVLGALAPDDLRDLFHGPEELLHYPSEAAAELHRRTDGTPASITAELAAWVRAGLCHWEDGRVRIDRPTIDALRSTLPALAGRGATLASGHDVMSLEPVRALAMTGDIEGAAEEALQVSRAARDSGHDGEAFAIALEAVRLARATREPSIRKRALRHVVAMAAMTVRLRPLDLARWEIESERSYNLEADALARFIVLCERMVRGDERLAEIAHPEMLPFFGDELLDRMMCIAFTAPVAQSAGRARAAYEAVSTWLAGDPDDSLERCRHIAGCIGRAAYSNLDFDMSAAFHEFAATRANPSDRLASLGAAASSHLDGYRLDQAEPVALATISLARSLRNPAGEMHGLRVLAMCRYRRGRPQILGRDFRRACTAISPFLAGVAGAHDAACHWRRGDRSDAARIADATARLMATARPAIADVPRAISAVAGVELTTDTVETMCTRATSEAPPGLGLQTLALLAMAGYGVQTDATTILAMLHRLEPRTWSMWREVLSAQECMLALGLNLPDRSGV